MVTENVNIVFRESGARVIKRKIDDIGNAANRATRGIFLLQRALFVVGGAGLVSGLARYADALTNLENRLRLTSTSTKNLETVQNELFAAANRSRSAVEATGEVYNRIALSTRTLGVSQQQVLNVTETLQKASIISGASAREANAALIQLGQGLASDRLSGDELRSVLEQLPAVADIIVDYLNQTQQFGTVTRGSLRSLGKEGKLTAELVFRAIEASQGKIARLFDETNPTIEQAFNVANNNLLKFIDTVDDATGASEKVARAIIFISENLDKLAIALAATATYFAVGFGIQILGRIQKYGGALAALTAIETQRARNQVGIRAAEVATLRTRDAQIAKTAAYTTQKLISARAEYAEATAAFQNGRARDAQTGRFIALSAARDRLTQATIRLNTAEAANNALTAASARNRAALTASETALTAQRARLTAATAAQQGVLARLSGSFPVLGAAVRAVASAFGRLGALAAANPLTAIAATVAGLVLAFNRWGNEIKVTSDGVVGLKDAVVAAFQLMLEFVQPVVDFIGSKFSQAVSMANIALGRLADVAREVGAFILDAFYNAFMGIPRIVVGVVNGVKAAWDILPDAAASIGSGIANGLIAGFEAFANGAIRAINKVIGALNSLLSFVGAQKAAEWFGFSGQLGEIGEITLDRVGEGFNGAGRSAAQAFTDGFNESWDQSSLENVASGIGSSLEPIGTAITERARRNIQDAQADARLIEIARQQELQTKVGEGTPGGTTATGGGGGGGNKADFASELAQIRQKIDLEKQYGLQKEVTNNIMQIEKTLKRELTQVEKDQVAAATQALEVARKQGEILQEIKGPQENLKITQQALNELFAQGAITLEQYNTKLRETQIAADRAANTLGGGFRAAIGDSIQSAGQFGEALGNWVVGAADKAADAVVEFAKTGKFNMRQFFQDLFAQLLKLAAQRLFRQLLGGFFGVPGGGFGGFSGGGSILPSFAGGGSMVPTGPGSTDTQVVAFNKRPDERVDILTPGQQAAQRKNLQNGMGDDKPVNVSPPQVNVAVVLSENDIANALSGEAGDTVIIRGLERNANSARKVLGGG